MHKTRTVTPPTILAELCSFETFQILVGKLFPLNKSESYLDMFAKLGINIKRYQVMCREQELLLILYDRIIPLLNFL